MTNNQRSRAKLLAAVVGGGAMVAMGAVATMLGSTSTGDQSIVSGPMTVGATVTETTPDTVLATPVAAPAVKATPYK